MPLSGARHASIDRRAASGAPPPAPALAPRYGRGSSASASASPNMMPAAFLHHETEPMVASRALQPPALATSASPTQSFAHGFYSSSSSSNNNSNGNSDRSLSSAPAEASASFHWPPTPLGALYASQTPLLTPTAAAAALPPLTPTPSLTAAGGGGGGGALSGCSSAHSWRFSATLGSSWSGPGRGASGGGAASPAHWSPSDEKQSRPRGRPSASPPASSRLAVPIAPLVLPPASAVAASAVAAPVANAPSARKRKRAPGAQRLRNFLCMHPLCGKSFTDSAHLRDHTVVHTGEKRLRCATCDRRFARLSTLHEHQRVHTGEKPYVCAAAAGCGKRYSSRAALRVHVATHFGGHRRSVGGAHRVLGIAEYDGRAADRATDACGRVEQRTELVTRALASGGDPASYGYAVGDHPSYAAPPSVAGEEINAEATAEAPTEHAATSTASLSNEAPVESATRWLEDTVRDQRDQIAALQQELERLRQQPQRQPSKRPSRQRQARESSASASTHVGAATDAGPAAKVAAPMTAPVEFLQDGVKPFACCVCSHRFVNFYQLTFHAKQHAGVALACVVGHEQAPLPVGPKFCPERGCEFSEPTGRSLRSLQTLKRHWQRRHQLDRPHECALCPPHRRKTFKTRENLKAHEKDCRRMLALSVHAPAPT